MFPSGIGTLELLVFGVIVLLVFGKRLPGVMRSLGASVVEFRRGLAGSESAAIDP